MSSAATVLGTRLGARLGTSVGVEGDPALNAILAILAAQSFAVWFDPDWDDGVDLVDDAGTERCVAIESRPIVGQAQHTVLNPFTPLGPATMASPNERRVMSFAGAQYLRGAGALAIQLDGLAPVPYSEVHIASKTFGGAMGRWSLGLLASSPDNRVIHYISGANTTVKWRSANGALTQNTGSTVLLDVEYVYSTTYNGSDYDGWLNAVEETLSGGGANTRAPETLDDLMIGAFHNAGNPSNGWQGMQAGLIITSPLSTQHRQALEIAVPAYYGYSL